MIDDEPDVARWRRLYRRRYGHEPPTRLVDLKIRNRAIVKQTPPTLQSIAAKIPPKVKPTLQSIAAKLAKRARRGRKPHSIQPRERLEILDEYDRGDKLDAIAAKHGCSRQHVRQIARTFGRVGRVVNGS